jgi:hypothetical protein
LAAFVTLPVARRQELLDSPEARTATLNNEPAFISGVYNDFATVRQRRSGLGCEWSWLTVEHVLLHCDGAFKS